MRVKEIEDEFDIKATIEVQESYEYGQVFGFFLQDGEEIYSLTIGTVEPVSDKLIEKLKPMLIRWTHDHLIGSRLILQNGEENSFCEPGNSRYTMHHFLANRSNTYIPFGV